MDVARPSFKTHQRLVKTTPKPRATKKSRGEELLLLLLLLGLGFPVVAADVSVAVGDDRVADVAPGVDEAIAVPTVEAACRTKTLAPSTSAGLMRAILIRTIREWQSPSSLKAEVRLDRNSRC